MRSAMVVVVVAGCSFSSDDPIVHVLENEGSICLFESARPSGAQMFAENAPVVVQYATTTCLSESCDVDRLAGCTVMRDANTVSVTSMASWSDIGPSEGICTDDCGAAFAQCTTDPLPGGTYTFWLGGASVSLAIPSTTDQAPCVETP